MNRKCTFFYSIVFLYTINLCSLDRVEIDPQPTTLSEQINYVYDLANTHARQLFEGMMDMYQVYRNKASVEVLKQELPKLEIQAPTQVLLEKISQFEVNIQTDSLPEKISDNMQEFELTKNQKYFIAISIACMVAAGIAYKKGCFFKSNTVVITEREIQMIIEEVVQNPLISKTDRLKKIFETLLEHNLTDIIICNEHTFEINGEFKVELLDTKVTVTHY